MHFYKNTFYNLQMAMQAHEENKEMMQNIDNVLDVMVDQTSTQVVNAKDINTELKEQDKIIDNVNDHMDTTTNNLDKATDRLKKLQTIGGGFGLMKIIIMVLLLLLILVVLIAGPKICDMMNCPKSKKDK